MPLAPKPRKTIPGSSSQNAYIGPCHGAAAVGVGCAVVVRFNTVDPLPAPPFNVIVDVVKLQLAPVGSALQVSEIFAPKTPCVGETTTLYCADWPAATVWAAGAIETVKLVAVKDAATVLWVVSVSLALLTVAVAS